MFLRLDARGTRSVGVVVGDPLSFSVSCVLPYVETGEVTYTGLPLVVVPRSPRLVWVSSYPTPGPRSRSASLDNLYGKEPGLRCG